MRWVAFGFCIAAAMGGAGLAALTAVAGSHFWSMPRLVIFGILPILVSAAALVALWRGDAACKQFMAYALAVAIAAWGAELYVGNQLRSRTRPAPGPEYSYAELRGEAIRAYPHLCGIHFGLSDPVLRLQRGPVQPVTGLPNNLLTRGKDRSTWRFTDRHGFNNPSGVWDRRASLLAVGDSFTFGADVPIGRGLVDRLRERLGSVINLGCGGNGPLLELASLAEFGALVRPQSVLWIYFEGNDLVSDLGAEWKSPILPNYLSPGFSQNLADEGPQIEQAVLDFLARAQAKAHKPPPLHKATLMPPLGRETVTLVNLRRALGLTHRYPPAALDRFSSVLTAAQRVAASWGGTIVFVYLPNETRYAGKFGEADAEAYAGPVRKLVAGMGIPVIDIAEAFGRQPQPRSLFRGHFTEEGYRLAADTIEHALARY